MSTIYANIVIKITGQILLFSGESADLGPVFGNTNTCLMSAGYTERVKLNEYLKGWWFGIVFLLYYGENKNRIWHCESVYVIS